MNLTPLGDRLIIRPIEEDDERPSGLVIPENAKTKTQRGEVLAAGPGRLSEDGERIQQDVAVGEKSYEHTLQQGVLSDDYLSDLGQQYLYELDFLFHT
ncbi:MAG: co-chaperone GroES [Chloroflexi bacterium]|nr:co-chaperone GroES [Chloroflexota bacterium]